MLCLVFQLISHLTELQRVLLDPLQLVPCPQFLAVKPWAGVWLLEVLFPRREREAVPGWPCVGRCAAAPWAASAQRSFVCSRLRDFTTSLYLEASPFV